MITCAMCDDELPFAEQLRSFVMAYAKKRRVELQAETFASAEELLEEIENGAISKCKLFILKGLNVLHIHKIRLVNPYKICTDC